MKIKFWIEHSTDCAYYHTSKVIEIPDELLNLKEGTDRIDGFEIIKEDNE